MHDEMPSRTSDARQALDFESPAFRDGEARGVLKRFARNGTRLLLGPIGGQGCADVVRLPHGIEVDVNNFVLPTMRRRTYLADEPLVMLRASLSCDVIFSVDGRPPMVFNRPELTLICVPQGMQLTVDGRGGVRQQSINGIFLPSAFADAYGLRRDDLPQELQQALVGAGAFGRIVSLPLDHHVAALVADTIDTPLEGDMRALQYGGRMQELVAYTLDAVRRNPPAASARALNWRGADLAQLALQRLSREYRKPARSDALARELGTNANKLQASFKSAFGVTMAEYCLERRMREAQQLLLEAKLSIAEVAERVGYAHQSNFAAAFSGYAGMPPREYRRHRAPVNLPLGDDGSPAAAAG
jgi:AraC-like DNA-binding protein